MPEPDDVFNDIGEQEGSPEAFKVLFFQYYPEILSFAVMCLQDRLVARTVTLEVFFLLWERHTDFDGEKAIKAFLYLAVRNKCLHNLPAGSRADLPPVSPPSSLPRDMLRDIFDYAGRSNFFAY
jgi:DNA-directed RNA polymerase specialized sigma24 family protein